MKIFKVRACGNTAEEAFYRAKADDAIDKKDCGINSKARLVASPAVTEASADIMLEQISQEPPYPPVAYYIHLGGGEYLFLGVTE